MSDATSALYINKQFTTLWLIGGYDCNENFDPTTTRGRTNVDLRVMGGVEIYKSLCVMGTIKGNVCAPQLQVEIITNKPGLQDIMIVPEGNIILCSTDTDSKIYICNDLVTMGNINNTNWVNGGLTGAAIDNNGNIIRGNIGGGGGGGWVGTATSNLNMDCFVISNVMALHVGNLYGKSPIDVHDILNMKDTAAGGKITWEAGIEIGNSSTITNYSNSIAIGKNATTKYDNTISIGHNTQSYNGSSICIGYNSQAYGSESVVIGSNLATNVNSDSYYNIVVGSNNFSKTTNMYGYNVIIGYGIANKNDNKPNYASPYSSVLIGKWVGQYSYYGMGSHNVGIGTYAFQYQGYYNDGGSFNIAIGYNSQRRGTSGSFNVAIGNDALGSVVNTYKYADEMIAIGSYAGYCLDSTGSIAIGTNSMGTILTSRNQTFESKYVIAIGYNSMRNIITGADYNTAIGHFAMGRRQPETYNTYKTTGTNNVCIGFKAGQLISNQSRNVLIGNKAGIGGVGSDSVSIGHNPTLYYGVSVGDKAVSIGSNTRVKDRGVGIGYNVLCAGFYSPPYLFEFGPSVSVAIGVYAESKSIGSTVIGPYAHNKIFYSDHSVAIGFNSYAEQGNSIAIGYNSNAQHGNSIAIGVNMTTTTDGGFFVKHNTVSSGPFNNAMFDPATNELVEVMSSMKFKEQIRDLEPPVDNIDKIRPVRYRPKEGYGNTERDVIGLIAEELVEIYPEFVSRDKDGLPAGIGYDQMVALLIKELQAVRERERERDLAIKELQYRLGEIR